MYGSSRIVRFPASGCANIRSHRTKAIDVQKEPMAGRTSERQPRAMRVYLGGLFRVGIANSAASGEVGEAFGYSFRGAWCGGDMAFW